MRFFQLILFIFLFSIPSVGQNLIANPSFENFNSTAWYPILTVDYLNPGPSQEGYINASHGSTCLGLRFFSPIADNWQEYVAQSIYLDMVAGETYRISFKYRITDRCANSTDDLGIGFVHNYVGNPSPLADMVPNMEAAIKVPVDGVFANYQSYTEFVTYYTATGTETWIVIGCFEKDATLTYQPINNPTNNPMPDIYFLIDEVAMYKCPTFPSSLLPDELILCDAEEAQIQTTTPADQYIWSNGSNDSVYSIHTTDQMIWVEGTFGNCQVRDTMHIKWFSATSDLGKDFEICGERDFPIQLSVEAEFPESVVWSNGETKPEIWVEEPGVYSVIKSLGDCFWTDTIQILDKFSTLLIYPNPTAEEIHFMEEENVIIKSISTENGKQVNDQPMDLSEFRKLIPLLEPAMYLISVENSTCKRIIKLNLINN